jgi:nicotinate-nucleotide adenylyltransferase
MPNAIGLLGGTFDPIHNGHIDIASRALVQLNLTEVQFIPCNIPAHRVTPAASIAQRVAMVECAIQDHPQFVLNTIELERAGPSYSIDTLQALQQHNRKLFFIVGADSYLSFTTWHRWQEISNYCTLVVYNRPGYSLPDKAVNAIFLQMPPCAISASEIRAAIKQRHRVAALVPTAVWEYIQRHELYR